MLKRLTPNLMVENVRETISFYRDILGFTLLATVPAEGETLDWVMMQRDGVQFMFQSRASLSRDVPTLAGVMVAASQTFYIEVRGIETLYENLKDKVEIVVEMRQVSYGTREFYFRDNNGYILSFSEPAAREG